MALPLLTARALNRATLARQLLLERVSLGPLEASEMVAGLQAQTPTDPYVALWSRLAGFDPDELSRSIEERKAVRAQLMRATIHLVTANDYPLFAGATRTVLERVFRSTPFAKALNGADMPRILEVSREALAEQSPSPAPTWLEFSPPCSREWTARRWPKRPRTRFRWYRSRPAGCGGGRGRRGGRCRPSGWAAGRRRTPRQTS